LILLADQLVVDGMMGKISKIIEEIFQSCVINRLLMARVNIRESPSKITKRSFRDKNN
jgi:hypothetical protein